MAKSQELANFENMVEKIIFNEDELDTLKIAIKNFSEGKTSAKELKGLLLQCRGRMVEDVTDFTFHFAQKRTETLLQTVKNNGHPTSHTKIESQLREEIQEKNELLEIVAQRVNQLVSKFNNEDSSEEQKPTSIDEVKEEIERCLDQIGANEWIEMCDYDDYMFFVKLYPKLEELYRERFGKSEKKSNDATEGKEIMANKMARLGFPEEVETILINYISIRDNFAHSMKDILPSNLDLAREVFVQVLVDLILNALDSKLLSNNKERLYSRLKDFFSERLTGNPNFRKRILRRLKTVF